MACIFIGLCCFMLFIYANSKHLLLETKSSGAKPGTTFKKLRKNVNQRKLILLETENTSLKITGGNISLPLVGEGNYSIEYDTAGWDYNGEPGNQLTCNHLCKKCIFNFIYCHNSK